MKYLKKFEFKDNHFEEGDYVVLTKDDDILKFKGFVRGGVYYVRYYQEDDDKFSYQICLDDKNLDKCIWVKSYEVMGAKFYWLVPTGDKLKIALNKVNAPQKFINKMLDSNYKESHIYIGQYATIDNWGWDNKSSNFKNSGSIFKGKVDVDDFEVSGDKYNL